MKKEKKNEGSPSLPYGNHGYYIPLSRNIFPLKIEKTLGLQKRAIFFWKTSHTRTPSLLVVATPSAMHLSTYQQQNPPEKKEKREKKEEEERKSQKVYS